MREIPLTQNLSALVDDEDYAWLSEHKWYAHRSRRKHGDVWYAQRTERRDGKKVTIAMHQAILKPTGGQMPDHINGNGLDNRRSNLRLVTQQQNQFNQATRGKYKGVFYKEDFIPPWGARIMHGGETIYLGYYETAEEAARAYDTAALTLFGQYAKTNFTHETIPATG
jgi:hypothetical protein